MLTLLTITYLPYKTPAYPTYDAYLHIYHMGCLLTILTMLTYLHTYHTGLNLGPIVEAEDSDRQGRSLSKFGFNIVMAYHTIPSEFGGRGVLKGKCSARGPRKVERSCC